MIDEDGYELWLRYRPVDDAARLSSYRSAVGSATVLGTDASAQIIQAELARALPALLDRPIAVSQEMPSGNALVTGTLESLRAIGVSVPRCPELGPEGFLIRSQRVGASDWIVVAGNTAPAVLTGTFHFLRLLQTHQDIGSLDVASCPRIRRRLLAHWDNLDGTIERGYAGRSLWNWDALPRQIDARYHDYARACASIGINGAVLNNVNANAQFLGDAYLQKIAALADVLRPYGIRVYLSPLLTAPVSLGNLPTSDPRDPAVAAWWKHKVDEIYQMIPDFGGFQVKADSEGQPGPQIYGANHADGANMLAAALEPHGGIVLWRAFVYDTTIDADRAKCAYKEFAPLDGRFESNGIVQVKNGPIDFQPREPFHPLFCAMKHTPLALELQITQEYLGQAIHLVYLLPMWKEILGSDTCSQGPGSTVASIVDGSLYGHALSSIVGVANSGSERNWCGHHFAQANWYAFGRLAWDHALTAEAIAEEWIRMTWSNDAHVVEAIKAMMLGSWQASINYMTPLGLHHLMQAGHHYGPDPGFNAAARADWNNVYYHRADPQGIGFDRSISGSNAVSQYCSPLSEQFGSIDTCPDDLVLWFHHAPWNHRLQSGRILWDELQYRYRAGIAFVKEMQNVWRALARDIDPARHAHVAERLEQQLENARQWRQVCLDYFNSRRYA